MSESLSETTKAEFSFQFLKACVKKLAYKCLQGTLVLSIEAIYKTLAANQKLIGKDLKELSAEFSQNKVRQHFLEFDCFNREIVERFERLGRSY